MSPNNTTRNTAESNSPSKGPTAEKRAAVKKRTRELNAAAAMVDRDAEVRTRIKHMPEPGRRLHGIVRAGAPDLSPRKLTELDPRAVARIAGFVKQAASELSPAK